ncbi:MAG: hypothetical protein LBK95_08380 [Bifidobacteriaceae bacterium]|jgi:hypothetical protein|nr:hypothetical protein [Bifidobacteriaceae bacterium]
MKRTRLAIALATTTVAAGLMVGCTDGDQVATLETDGPASPASQEPPQTEAAQDMAACLTAADIPATAEPIDGAGTPMAVQVNADQMSLVNFGGGTGLVSLGSRGEETTQAEQEAFYALVAQHDPSFSELVVAPQGEAMEKATVELADKPFLVIGPTDHTEALVKCLEETGYTQPEYVPDAEEELAAKQADLEVTIAWAECARQHGVTEVVDPQPPKADRHMTQPTALLPTGITAQQLQSLLEDCPSFDHAPFEARDVAEAELGPDATQEQIDELYATFPIAQPQIGFDAPGFNGDVGVEPDPELAAKLGPLMEMLARPGMEYWAEKEGHELGQGVG